MVGWSLAITIVTIVTATEHTYKLQEIVLQCKTRLLTNVLPGSPFPCLIKLFSLLPPATPKALSSDAHATSLEVVFGRKGPESGEEIME